jgi:uncharacterized protein (TIGR03437 family)
MHPSSLVLAVLVLRTALAQAPAYAAENIVNSSDYTSGPFAPNSVLTIFGTNLSWYTQALTLGKAGEVPTQLSGVQVLVDSRPAPLLYVSGPQINFLIPSNEISGQVTVRVVREGMAGPQVTVKLIDVAPALFDIGTGYAITTHADGTLLTDASPGQPGEIVVIYATGLGHTQPNADVNEVPGSAAPIEWLGSLTVSLDGAVLPSYRIKYAGITPGCLGLYQLNLELPLEVGANPAILVSVGAKSSTGNLKLAVQ